MGIVRRPRKAQVKGVVQMKDSTMSDRILSAYKAVFRYGTPLTLLKKKKKGSTSAAAQGGHACNGRTGGNRQTAITDATPLRVVVAEIECARDTWILRARRGADDGGNMRSAR